MKRFSTVLTLLAVSCGGGSSVVTGHVDVEGGRLYFEESGSGEPLVMIHGGSLDRRMWDGQFDVFAERYRVIRYDVRAHGLSRSDSTEFADHEDLLRLLDARGIRRAAIVGLSLGGMIAADFALAHPQRVTALVLVGSGISGFEPSSEFLEDYVEDITEAFEAQDFPAAMEAFARWWCDGPFRTASEVDPAVRAKVMEMLSGSGERWRYWHLARTLEPPAMGRLEAISVPTLVIVGSIDMPDILELADTLVARIPAARKVVIPDVAHMVNMEKPSDFNEAVLEFLAPAG